MTFSLATGDRKLHVIAATPLDEIFVIDGGFKRVAKGLGELTVSLPVGVYTIKFKTGESVSEETLVLNARDRVVNRRPDPAPAAVSLSPAPRASRGSFWPRLLGRLRIAPTLGGGLDIGWSSAESPASNLGAVMVDELGDMPRIYSQSGEEHTLSAAPVSKHLSLPAGVYLAELPQSSLGLVSVSLPVFAGWVTRLFWTEAGRPGGPDRASGMRVLITRPSTTHLNEERDWLDRAMASLQSERRTVPDAMIRTEHPAALANPMLLLCWAHMLLLGSGHSESDSELFGHLIKRLQKMVADHPDVQVLALYAGRDARERPPKLELSSPPMFWRSWRLLDHPFMRERVVIAPGSLAESVVSRSAAAGIWLALSPQKTAKQPSGVR